MARYWLLKVTFAGIDYRWSSTPLEPLDAAGLPVQHMGGLPDLRLSSDYDPLRRSPNLRSVSLELAWPKYDPIHTAIEEGHNFTAAVVELALWTEGEPYETREVVLRGRPEDQPEYGGESETVTFTVKPSVMLDDVGSTHLPDMAVSPDTWPEMYADRGGGASLADFVEQIADTDTALDRPYPLPFGVPGKIVRMDSFGGPIYSPSSPAIPVELYWSGVITAYPEIRKLLVSGWPVGAETVRIACSSVIPTVDLDVTTELDGQGQPCSVVEVSSAILMTAGLSASEASDFLQAVRNEWRCIWTDENPGIVDGATGQCGAGFLAEWILRRSTIEVDWQHLASVRRELDQYTLAGFIEQPVPTAEMLDDAVLGDILPVSVTVEANGVRLVPFPWLATYLDAVETIEVGPGVTTPERVSYERLESPAAQYRVSWCPTGGEADYRQHLTLMGERVDGYTIIVDSAVRAQAADASDFAIEHIESAWIGDHETAARVARWRAFTALPARLVRVQYVGDRYDHLEDGQPVLVNDADRGIEARLGVVSRDILAPNARNLTVRLLPDIA